MAKRQYNTWRELKDGTVEIELTQGKVALIDKDDANKVLQYKWYAWNSGSAFYATTCVTIASYKEKTFRLHRFLLGLPKGVPSHFHNGNTLDCRRCNMQAYSETEVIPKSKNKWRQLPDGSIEIELTQGQVTLIDSQDLDKVIPFKWNAHFECGRWYAYAAGPRGKKAHSVVRMHRIILDAPVGLDVDHVDRDGLNNRRSNIRLATRSQNLANQAKRQGTSRYKGVYLYKRTGKWIARLTVRGKAIHLGCFDLEIAAALAYNTAALKHFGEFARLNDV